ncbi:MAG: acetylxylan esterase [Candidatus Sumerlaeota bacterium]|nr:acetylxylan esterase [Candidatus Sumerlaeota bacterium]
MMKSYNAISSFMIALLLSLGAFALGSSQDSPNYDESKVNMGALPDPLACSDGSKVTTPEMWREKRRPEILELFRANMHGRSPKRPAEMKFEVTSIEPKALNGLATRKEITVLFSGEKDGPLMHLLLYVPNSEKKPAPAFLGVNFDGNHRVTSETGVTITEQWTWDNKAKTESLIKPGEDTRGKGAGQWQLEMVLKRGYAVATIPRADIEPDYPDGWKHGVRGYYLKKSGKTEFEANDWGAIAAWAWGLSRALDYLETDRDIDAKRVVVMGHSRMGKTALWAGAADERFAIVISNDSGEGGAALARRWYGEMTAGMNKNFPHWFCANFKQYAGNEDAMPMDQHELIALSAPRPLYVASAQEDKWADPRGEFLAAKNAGPVYRLFGKEGVGAEEMPAVNQPVGKTIGYHIRTGKHDVLEFDWEQYLSFADRHLGR